MTREVYNQSVDKLLDAYNKNELFHGICDACAVGNLCRGDYNWAALFRTGDDGVFEKASEGNTLFFDTPYEHAMIAIGKSNCSRDELEKIENAFEMAIHNTQEGFKFWVSEENEKQGQYMGLCAVLDVMKDMIEDDEAHEDRMLELNTIAESKGVLVNA